MKTIPEIMYSWAAARPPKNITRVSPSMLGRCMRTHYFAIKGVKETTPPNPGAQLNFKVGFMWEQVMTDALRNANIPFIEQYHMINEDLNMEGTIDFAPFDPETMEFEVWDSKTEGMMAANYRKREGKSFFNAHPEYVHQLNAYCILMRSQGFTVTTGRFGVIVKDNGLVSEDITKFPEQSINTTIERIEKLNSYLTDDVIPDCECEGWQVGYCGFGNPHTLVKNKTGKMVNSECCPLPEELEEWRESDDISS